MLGKRKHYESRRHVYLTPHMLGQSLTNWRHNTLSVPKNEVRAGHELRKTEFQGTNCVQGQIYKRFVRSNGNIVLIIPKTFFEVRPINYLKTIYCRKWRLIFLHNEIVFLDLRTEKWNKIMVLASVLQFSRLKKEASKKGKALDGIWTRASRYLWHATISSTSADHINLKIFLKICCFEKQFYLHLQTTLLRFTRNIISIVQNPI